MRKGIAPLLALGIALIIIVIGALFYIFIQLQMVFAGSMALDFFEIVELKNVFELTVKSLEGGLLAISSEAVFHTFDTGYPDYCDPSCYQFLGTVTEMEPEECKMPEPRTQPLAKIGESCKVDGDCESDCCNQVLWECVISDFCNIHVPLGEVCNFHSECWTDCCFEYHDGISRCAKFSQCSAFTRRFGDECDMDSQCLSVCCLSGICAKDESDCFSPATTTSTTTDSTVPVSTTVDENKVYETSYRKYPIEWIEETDTIWGSYKNMASWTKGRSRYIKFESEDKLKEYLQDAVLTFMKDHLADSFTRPLIINLEYDFSEISFEDENIVFSIAPLIEVIASQSRVEKRSIGPYDFSYPLSTTDMFNAYLIARKIITGFDPADGISADFYKPFADIITGIANSHDIPTDISEYSAKEESLSSSIRTKLAGYETAIAGISLSTETGLETEFISDEDLFSSTLKTEIETDFRKKYEAYLIDYTVLVDIRDPSAESFCCNWNPLSNLSIRDVPALNILLNDTFLALECDEEHATAIWREHRDDCAHKICEKTGVGYSWHEFSEYPQDYDLLVDLDDDGNYDSFWDQSMQNWYRCGYGLGDVVRVDLLSPDELAIEMLADSEQIIQTNAPYPLEGKFEGVYGKRGSFGAQDTGELICAIEERTCTTDSPGGCDSIFAAISPESEWLRCTDAVQDFRILSEKGLGSDENFYDKYCCIGPSTGDKHICVSEDQMDDRNCCECFGNVWEGSDDTHGYCIGDGWCEALDGEDATKSQDCCRFGSEWVEDSVVGSETIYRLTNFGTQSLPSEDNVCHLACEAYGIDIADELGESSPYCSGPLLTQCDGNVFDCSNGLFGNSDDTKCIEAVCLGVIPKSGCKTSELGGGECYSSIIINNCGPHTCNINGLCNANDCSMACGAVCEKDPFGDTSGCADICGPDNLGDEVESNILLLERTCDETVCACTGGTEYECNGETGTAEKLCNGKTYQCVIIEGANYEWQQKT